MREILFRGFHECENGTEIAVVNGKEYRGEWVFGYFWTNEAGNYFIKVIRDLNGNFVGNPTTNDYEVFPETVGQFTGLTDKNGRRIFEGDILQLCKATYPCLVYWNGAGWSIERNGKRVIYACDMDIAHDLRNMEVIGTIFDKAVAAGETGVCGICGRRLPMSELNQWELSIVDRLRYGLQHNQSVTLGADEVHIPMNAIIERGDRRAQPENKPLDAVPVVRGEWIPTDMGGGEADEAYVCSACGEPWTLIDGTPHENNMNYCPNCGAKMEATP